MKFHKSFRFRIFISLWVFGILLVIMYAVLAIMFRSSPSQLSERIYTDLRYEWDYFNKYYKIDNNTPLTQSRFIKTYTDISDLPSEIHKRVAGIKAGYHRISIPDKDMTYVHYIAVQDHPGHVSKVYMIYDYDRLIDESATHFKNRAFKRFLLAFVIIAVLSLLVGFFLTKKIIAPFNKLSELVKASDPENLPVDLSKNFPENEIGLMAGSFETAMIRVRDFIEREKCFTRDSSHELRTPVSVIKGAVELMHEIPVCNEKPINRLMQRIERSIKNMEVTIETFLWLGRESQDIDDEQISNMKSVVEESVQDNQYLLQGKPVSIDIQIEEDIFIRAPEAILKIAIVNLIRNAFYYTPEGRITIFSNHEYVEIRDTGIGVESDHLKTITVPHVKGQHSKGFGLGLAIVERLSKRFDWQMDISSNSKGGTKVRIDFNT